MALECRIELNKTGGVTIHVEDAEAKKSQEIRLDGNSMTSTVKDGSNTSTIIQKPDSIAIACSKFSVVADEVTVTSKQKTTLESDGTTSLTSKGSLSAKTDDTASIEAVSNLNLKAMAISSTADTSAKVKASTITEQADSISIEGQSTTVSGSASTTVSGMSVSVKADTTMNVEGMTTNVKG
ncbi:MAG: hypothetical protein RIQ52_642 [Pseudomonadota bacterium]|jgi:hypothetical protein